MANSSQRWSCGLGGDVFLRIAPAKTPGTWGLNDQGDITTNATLGDCRGPLGLNDYGAPTLAPLIRADLRMLKDFPTWETSGRLPEGSDERSWGAAAVTQKLDAVERLEVMSYSGEDATDIYAFAAYLEDVQRGKSLLQLSAMAETDPETQAKWSPRSFTAVEIDGRWFSAVVCNMSYHYHKHAQEFGSIVKFTQAAEKYFQENKALGQEREGLLKFPDGSLFEKDGRIVTFIGR